MVIIIILLLIIAIAVLIFYNVDIYKKLQSFNNINQKINSLSVLQDFMNVTGTNDSVEEKLRKVNEIIIEKYEIKYSTIVVFNGAEYIVKTSNVDPKHYDALLDLHNEEIFKDSVATATPKYITIEKESEKLPYQKSELGRAKSAMFFPLYIDNVYVGYWIMESGQMHAFDNTDTTIIEVVKENIIAILKTVAYQDTLENIPRKDEFTGLYSAEYLYGRAKKAIDQYTTSAVCMFRINNIEEINESISRQMGNSIIIEVSNVVKAKLTSRYIFVRYMGPKFAIIFTGVDEDSIEEFLKEMKADLESIQLVDENGNQATPRMNFVISTYYKGTGIEQVTAKMEEYLDEADRMESEINYI